MPTYNVRMDVGEGPDQGELMDFADADAACHDAQVAMAEAAKEKVPGTDKAHLAVEIDDMDGATVFRGEMDFTGRKGCVADPIDDAAAQSPIGPRE